MFISHFQISKGSQLVKSYDLEKLLEEAQCGGMQTAKEKCFVYLKLGEHNERKLGPDNYNFLTKLSAINVTGGVKVILRYGNAEQLLQAFIWLLITFNKFSLVSDK